jgi:hypothetical protein
MHPPQHFYLHCCGHAVYLGWKEERGQDYVKVMKFLQKFTSLDQIEYLLIQDDIYTDKYKYCYNDYLSTLLYRTPPVLQTTVYHKIKNKIPLFLL